MDNPNKITFNEKEITNIDLIKLQKMTLLYNALENGWSIKKADNCYVFKKKILRRTHTQVFGFKKRKLFVQETTASASLSSLFPDLS